MTTNLKAELQFCILCFLRDMPQNHLQTTASIENHAALYIAPTPSPLQTGEALKGLESLGYINSTEPDPLTGSRYWAITRQGRLYLADK